MLLCWDYQRAELLRLTFQKCPSEISLLPRNVDKFAAYKYRFLLSPRMNNSKESTPILNPDEVQRIEKRLRRIDPPFFPESDRGRFFATRARAAPSVNPLNAEQFRQFRGTKGKEGRKTRFAPLLSGIAIENNCGETAGTRIRGLIVALPLIPRAVPPRSSYLVSLW